MKKRTKQILVGLGAVAAVGTLVYVASTPARPQSLLPTKLAWGAKFSPEERAKILAIGQRLQINPSILTSIMTAESGRNAHIHIIPVGKDKDGNTIYQRSEHIPIEPGTIGGGLIGFMRRTAEGMGTTLGELLALERFDQLDWVEKFYQLHRNSGVLPANPSLWRAYMATFLPKYAHEADNPEFILAAKDSPIKMMRKIYIANAAADRNKDGEITVGEAMARIDGILRKGLKEGNVF